MKDAIVLEINGRKFFNNAADDTDDPVAKKYLWRYSKKRSSIMTFYRPSMIQSQIQVFGLTELNSKWTGSGDKVREGEYLTVNPEKPVLLSILQKMRLH